jgi:DNA-binding winged helix-turn-helix (wHTH) protein
VIVLFDDLELDLSRVELRRSGVRVRVERQVFEVLAYLVDHRERVVTKEELMDSVWGGRFVSESAVTSRIKQVRQAVGDDGRTQRLVRTVHGHGYRFVGTVRELARTPAPRPAPVHYAQSDDLQIAYQVTGQGERDIVLVVGFVSHLELDWGDPRHAAFLDGLSGLGRLIRFDKRGTGMSDRPLELPDMETRMHDVLAVMDAAGSERTVLFGYSEGGPMSILMAAMHPERVEALILYGTYARRLRAADYPWAQTPEEREQYMERLVGRVELGGRYEGHVPVRGRGDGAVVGSAGPGGGHPVDGPRPHRDELLDRCSGRPVGGAGAHARDAPTWRSRQPRRRGPLPGRAHPWRALHRAVRRGPLRGRQREPDPRTGQGVPGRVGGRVGHAAGAGRRPCRARW